MEPRATTSTLSPAELAEYLLDLGGTLLSYGCPTHRLEAVIREIAVLEGHSAEAFAVPTGLFVSLRSSPQDAPFVRMVRVPEWGVDLGRLARVDRIFNDVLERKCTLAEARRRIDEASALPRAPTWLRWGASVAATGSSAIFFRGGLGEVAVAALGGLLLAGLRSFLSHTPRARLLQDFLGGALASGLAWGATRLWPDLSRQVLVLSVVILLVPGMALTSGLSEVAHKNLISGAARLTEAMMGFLSIVFGIAAVAGLEQMLHLAPVPVPPLHPVGWPFELGALLASALAFGVIFAVPRPYLPHVVLTAAAGWVVSGLGAQHVPPAVAAFSSAVLVSLLANLMARLTQRPAQVFLLPGLALLVPGSFGFLSLDAFLRGEFLGGAASGFEMFLIAGAIVTGLLFANVLLPARKLL